MARRFLTIAAELSGILGLILAIASIVLQVMQSTFLLVYYLAVAFICLFVGIFVAQLVLTISILLRPPFSSGTLQDALCSPPTPYIYHFQNRILTGLMFKAVIWHIPTFRSVFQDLIDWINTTIAVLSRSGCRTAIMLLTFGSESAVVVKTLVRDSKSKKTFYDTDNYPIDRNADLHGAFTNRDLFICNDVRKLAKRQRHRNFVSLQQWTLPYKAVIVYPIANDDFSSIIGLLVTHSIDGKVDSDNIKQIIKEAASVIYIILAHITDLKANGKREISLRSALRSRPPT